MPKSKDKLVLIDGNALIHRAFHALPPLTTSKGEIVNAIFGFTSILLRALKDLKPEYIAVAFDTKKKTFRDKLYKEYKATRAKAPQELYDQIPRVHEVVKTFNIPAFGVDGYEADDVIGTVSKIAEKKGVETVIVTGDKDTLQLVDKDTKVYTPKKGMSDSILYDPKMVKNKFDITPDQLIDYKGLAGDSSDNIPGVPGVGDKTATSLLRDFKNIENLYKELHSKNPSAKIQKLPDCLKKKLLDNEDQAKLSKKLATIVCDVPLKFELKKCIVRDYDRAKVVKLFQELGFKSLLARLPEAREAVAGEQSVMFQTEEKISSMKKGNMKYELIDSGPKLSSLVKELKKISSFAIDTETTSERVMEAELVGVSVSFKKGEAYYIPAAVLDKEGKDLVKIIGDEKIKKIGQNMKFDYLALKNHGIEMRGLYFDTMIASYLLNSGSRRHNLNDMVFTEFGYEMMPFDDLVGKGKDKKKITEVSLDRLTFYAAEDADYTWQLYEVFKKKLKREKALEKLFYDIEMPLILVLAVMEENGIKVDIKFLKGLSVDFSKDIDKLTYEIYKIAGTSDFNINSTQQLSKILFEKLKIDTGGIKRTTTGYSTASSELDKLKKKHKIIPLIEKYREYKKLKSTYIDALPKLVNKKTKRLHTSFNQTVTATGRLSSSNPNLQNIPIRTELGRHIRRAFIADRGYNLLSADYSQIDLRVVAHISGDNMMLTAFKRDEDIHARTAALVFGKDIKKITPDDRRVAKTVNFGVVYGMGAYGLARTLGMGVVEAQDFIDGYFKTYPGLRRYTEETIRDAKKRGYVETLLGRRRYLPDLKVAQPMVRATAERMAINMPVQGTAADIIKIAMNNLSAKDLIQTEDCLMLIQVHDELLFEIKDDKLDKLSKEIEKIMSSAYKLIIPLKVDLKAGKNWEEMKPL